MIVIRLILRFLLVPLGGLLAALVAASVVCFAHWAQFTKIVSNDPTAPENILLAVLLIGPAVIVIMSVGASVMLAPATLGALIAEIFAFRSWLYHVTNGAVASAIGWKVMEDFLKSYEFYSDAKIVIAAGIAAGFTYWAVAGWSAGFWKPVFTQSAASPPTTAPV